MGCYRKSSSPEICLRPFGVLNKVAHQLVSDLYAGGCRNKRVIRNKALSALQPDIRGSSDWV